MKVIRLLLIFVISLIWLSAKSNQAMKLLNRLGIHPRDYNRFGDLYRFSNLPQFKSLIKRSIPSPCYPDTSRTRLYIIGDSFTDSDRISKADFPINSFQFIHWNDNIASIKLDKSLRNVLLFETIERHLRERVAQPPLQHIIIDSTSQEGKVIENKIMETVKSRYPVILLGRLKKLSSFIQSNDLESQLENILFNYPVFLWFKETKATLNFTLFKRTDRKISLSKNKKSIFYYEDIENPLCSSYSELSDDYIDSLVNNINVAAARYRQAGFSEIILSIIPNKPSILDPVRSPFVYNQLANRIQYHPQMKLAIVDVYSIYQKRPYRVYELGDSHWSILGREIWLNEVRKHL